MLKHLRLRIQLKARRRRETRWLWELVATLQAKAMQNLDMIFEKDRGNMQSAE